MRYKLGFAWVLMSCLLAAQARSVSSRGNDRLIKEVRHQILMLPYFGVFDNIAFRVDGYTITLYGDVTRPVLKSDAERVVKRIEGVEHVDNRIRVLPLSILDDQLRRRLYYSIYGYGPLQRYSLGAIKPIRIIVANGNVTLEGVVDNQMDRNLANIRANGVPGVFSVTNHLRVGG